VACEKSRKNIFFSKKGASFPGACYFNKCRTKNCRKAGLFSLVTCNKPPLKATDHILIRTGEVKCTLRMPELEAYKCGYFCGR
jgi:hypothetical protein